MTYLTKSRSISRITHWITFIKEPTEGEAA